MNGAEIIIKTAVAAGIDVCFSNPGTTEMPLVAALSSIPGIQAKLGLFEGCCTGAADGYARMIDKPALTLLHLGPGLANGIANLHNAHRANSPVVNIVGEHASWHRSFDAPLTMDIEALAGAVSGWQRTSTSVETLSKDTADAISAAMRGQVSSLIVPNDFQWSDCMDETISKPHFSIEPVDYDAVKKAAKLLKTDQKTVIILGGRALKKKALNAAARIKAKTGCDLLAETFPARMERGAGIPALDRIPYFPEQAVDLLSKYQVVILAGAKVPVAFFGYKGMSSKILSEDQKLLQFSPNNQNLQEALECLADALDAPKRIDTENASSAKLQDLRLPEGRLSADKVCVILAALQPENAIIVEEAITTGVFYYKHAANAPSNSLLTLNGGSLGLGMPCAVGAAVACPDRPVISFQADGAAMYTVQALWMQARESLNITTLICANRSYDILKFEFARAGYSSPKGNASELMDLSHPVIDWVKISEGMGVPAVSVDSAEKLSTEMKRALAEPGPHLIAMVL